MPSVRGPADALRGNCAPRAERANRAVRCHWHHSGDGPCGNPAQLVNVAPRGSRRPPARQHALRRKVAAACLVAIAVIVALAATSGSTSPHVRIPTGPPPSALAPPSPQELVDDSHRREDAAIDRVLSYTPFVLRGGSQHREIALTFDDGPGPYSLALLSVLKRLRVPATYFEVGSQERYFSSATQAQIAAGYFVEDHTETHPELAALSPTDQQNEIFEQPATITPYGAPYPRLFRPPYGSFNSTTLSLLREAHMLMVLWTVDTDDYLLPGVDAIVHSALAGAEPGAIILMHDAGGVRTETIAALPRIVAALRARGYVLVSVPRLLLDDPPPPGQKLPTGLSGS